MNSKNRKSLGVSGLRVRRSLIFAVVLALFVAVNVCLPKTTFADEDGSSYAGAADTSGEKKSLDWANAYIQGGDDGYERYWINSETIYLYNGKPVCPRIYVGFYDYQTGSYQLTEGVDYTVEYVDNTGVDGGYSDAKAVITGIGDYCGTKEVHFTVARKMKFADACLASGFSLSLTWDRNTKSAPNGSGQSLDSTSAPEFLYSGKAIMPVVSLEKYGLYNNYEPKYYKAPADFGVTYTDENGKECNPVDPGLYYVHLVATASSDFFGSVDIPFRVVEKTSLGNSAWSGGPELRLSVTGDGVISATNYTSTPGGGIQFDIYGVVDSATSFVFSLTDGVNNLIEGLDYIVKAAGDGFTNDYVWDGTYSTVQKRAYKSFVISGIGDYAGNIYAQATIKPASTYYGFSSFNVNGVYCYSEHNNYRPEISKVYLNSDGSIINPSIEDNGYQGVIRGIDYELAGFTDLNGNSVESAADGQELRIIIKGLGKYSGCKFVGVVEASADSENAGIDIGNMSIAGLVTPGSVKTFNSEGINNYLLKTATPNVGLQLYQTRTLLREGEGFKLVKSLNAAGDRLTVSAYGDEAYGYRGKTETTYKLVDKYDIDNLIDWDWARFCTSSASVQDGCYYGGIPYTPVVRLHVGNECPGQDILDSNSYDVSYLNPDGEPRDQIDCAGEWTAVITGKGDWAGTHRQKFDVEEDPNGVNLADCSLTFGEWNSGKPAVSVSFNSQELIEGRDYVVQFGYKTDGGGYAVVKPAKGSKFYGRLSKTFGGKRILSNNGNITCSVLIGDRFFTATYYNNTPGVSYACRYENHPVEPKVTIHYWGDGVDNSDEFLDSSCYDVEYGNNNAPGTAWVKVTGKNGYLGTVYQTFTIPPNVLAAEVKTSPVTMGSAATFDASVSGDAGAKLSYAWEQSTNGGKTWKSVSSAGDSQSMTYLLKEARSGYLFRCTVTASDGRTATSEPVGFSVAESLTLDGDAGSVDASAIPVDSCPSETVEGASAADDSQL